MTTGKVRPPRHDKRIKGPTGGTECRGGINHCTVSNQVDGPSDRHNIIDFLAGMGISVPAVTDDDGSTIMTPLGTVGAWHSKGLTDVWGVEQVGQAYWSRAEWLERRATVENAGKWGAWLLAEKLGVAVTLKNLKKLFVGHDRDHVFGGTSDHWDPGPHYPWDVCYEAAIAHALKEGYRVIVTKNDKRKVRTFRASRKRQAYAWAVKRLKRGWRVVVKRQKFPPAHEFGPQ